MSVSELFPLVRNTTKIASRKRVMKAHKRRINSVHLSPFSDPRTQLRFVAGLHCILTMSSSLSDLGEALRPDGTLKDASEILWHYDEDESLAFPLGSTSIVPSSSSARHSSATMVAVVLRQPGPLNFDDF